MENKNRGGRPRKPDLKQRVDVVLTISLQEKIRAYANRHGVSISSVYQEQMEKFIRENGL
jgi:hypothetical protein